MSNKNIKELRTEIDKINQRIIELISKRTSIGERIGKLKKKKEIPIHQPDREDQIIKICRRKAREEGLEEEKIERIFKDIISISRNKQMKEGAEK